MIRRFLKFQILSILFVAMAFVACEEQEVADPISTEKYPTATFEFTNLPADNVVNEGTTITCKVKFDRMIDVAVAFEVKIYNTGTADEHDYIIENATMEAYSKETTITIDIPVDGPEVDETLKFEVGAYYLGTRYLVNPKTVYPVKEITIKNVNDPSGLTCIVGWDNHEDDWDLMIIDEAITGEYTGYMGATGANPETAVFKSVEPDGTYYAELDPYEVVNEVITFDIALGHPNGSVEFHKLKMDVANIANYPIGSGLRIVKIVKVDGTFTCTLESGYEPL